MIMSEEKRHIGTDNLIPFGQPGREAEERAMQSKGGKKSGETRRRKRDLKKAAKSVLEAKIPPKNKKQLSGIIGEIEDDNDMLYTAAVAVMMSKALQGDVAAFRAIQDIVGEIGGSLEESESVDDFSRALEEMGAEL